MENNLINEIIKLQYMKNNTVIEINNNFATGFLYRSYNEYGIAIPFDKDVDINESFVGITLSTSYLNYNNISIRVLYLHVPCSVDIEKFCYIGALFLKKENRDTIVSDPYLWADEWKQIFGNSLESKMIYDVIGELIALKYIYTIDKSAIWEGPNRGTHDIVCDSFLYEVKSTKLKNDNLVSINSAFQLSNEKKEKLIFCRLELKPYSNSINTLVKELVCLGYDEISLESALYDLGYGRGSRNRDLCYDVLEIKSYDVNNENFPLISLEKLNELGPKNNIVNYSLVLDLKTIPCESLKLE